MRISPEKWEEVKALFEAALELELPAREAFLRTKSADDSVRAEVERLLAEYDEAGTFLSSPALAAIPLSLKRQANRFSEGEILGEKFKILRFVAHGGMGEVYEAEDLELHERVALKTLRPDNLQQSAALARLKREVHLARKVTHPNVCRIFDLYRHKSAGSEEIVVLSMEFLRGETLAERIKRQGRMGLLEALPLIRQMASALGAAHEAGIVHRDFKPSNVVLVDEPTGLRAVVTDFGLAFRATAPATEHSLTDASWSSAQPGEGGQLYGTPAYMAPEQIEGRPATIASDIYAFGLVIYEMITGVRPFQGDTPISTAVKRLVEAPPPPRKFEPTLTPACESVILRCLEREPANRFAKAQDVAKALAEEASPSGAVNLVRAKESYQLPGRRIRGWLSSVTIMLLVCLLGAGFFLWRRNGHPATPAHMEYTQVTNFADSVTSPALSPDGRILAFIRGENPFMGPGDVYVKLLPNGEPIQLTHDDHPKMGLVFSSDGSRIAFTRGKGWDWQTWTVPVLGGEPSELLPNASGLTWVGPYQVMFSEMGKGTYTKIVTAGESRANERDVYLPKADTTMAHRSYLSPDSKWVLVVEMGSDGVGPCRLVPFKGGSEGKQVGPMPSDCTEAAWSPDGHWMYFAAKAGGGSHLWRQRFPDGDAEQITYGATEERGVAVAPDAKSLVTSVGSQQSTVWVHGRKGEQQISSYGFAYMPSLSADSKRLYYLVRSGIAKFRSGELWSADLSSGHKEQLIPGILIARYTVSPDGKDVVFTRADSGRHSSIWIWPLDRHSSPRQLVGAEADTPFFSGSGEIFFVRGEGGAKYVFRMKEDGTELQKAIPDRISNLIGLSPDGRWIVAATETGEPRNPQIVVGYQVRGGPSRVLCRMCAIGGLEIDPPIISWSSDQKSMYVSLTHTGSHDKPKTIVIPLNSSDAFPEFSSDEFVNYQELTRMPGVRVLDLPSVFPGPDTSTYAFWRINTQRNIYRIGLP
jgi:eukaryotic-like serine/threonine-protein kinase